VLQGLLPAVRTPVHIVSGAHDDLVPPSNGRYLAQRLPDSQLSILDTGHFAWEQVPDQYAAIIAESVARAEARAPHE
jgi:pimeloyl-ACP methyl ester carboxylesterase